MNPPTVVSPMGSWLLLAGKHCTVTLWTSVAFGRA
jgi:hypothetical protein